MTGRAKTSRSEPKASTKRRKRDSSSDRADSNITVEGLSSPAPTLPTPRARARTPELKAKAIERLAAGEGVVALAAELGADRKTLYTWSREAGVAQKAALTMEQAAERGRKILIEGAEKAARRVVKLVSENIIDKGVASGRRVNLSAALELLNRVGLHPKQGVEVTDNTLTSIFDRYAPPEEPPRS